MAFDEQNIIMMAIHEFTSRATVPLLYDNDEEGVDQVGTGTLFSISGRCFLITAAHTYDKRDPGRFAIPKGKKNNDLHSIGPGQFITAEAPDADLDVAIYEIFDATTIEYLEQGWLLLGLENISSPSTQGNFVLCGYPSERASRDNSTIRGSLFTLFTDRMAEVPANAKSPVVDGVDLFFHYPNEAPTLDGKVAPLPALPGVSGAGVWEYRHPTVGEIWTPHKTLSMIGVETGYIAGQWFRAKSWDFIRQMLGKIDSP